MTEDNSDGQVGSGHVDHKCECHEVACMFCEGGLTACVVCESFEGATTSECPGERMTREQADAVYAGRLDFRGGKWREGEAARYSPEGSASWLFAIKTGQADEPSDGVTWEGLGACPPGREFWHKIPCTCEGE